MTWPVTPNPSIHDDTKGVKQTSPFSEAQLATWIERLPLAMIKDLADAILAALGLGGIVPTANTIITDVYNALLDIPQGNISGLIGSLEDIVITIVDALGGQSAGKDLQGLLAEASSLLSPIAQAIENLPTEIESIAESLPIISTILQLLGIGGSSSGSTTPTTPTTPTLQQLLGSSQITADQLKALTPSSSKNLLADPGFDTGAGIQGNGQWCWEGWIGTGGFGGVNSSIRTVRPGVITIYNIVGTSQGTYMWGNEPVGIGAGGIILEYLRTNLLGWLGNAVSWALDQVDQAYFEWINVPYPAASYPMGPSVQAGHDWLVSAINQIPGPFFFVMDSQGNQVGASVYDELRYGTLQSRNNDFLGALGLGNLRREEGHYFPGCPDLAPGTSGMCCTPLMTTGPYVGAGDWNNPKIGNLIDTEDRWWDFAVPGDYFACTPIQGNTVDPGPDAIGGNVGDIPGIPGTTLREFYSFVNYNNTSASVIENWLTWSASHGDGFGILGDFLGAPMNQINALGAPDSPHQSYYKDTRPLASRGDNRTFMEIGLDYINSFVGGYHPDGTPIAPPPLVGLRHQYELRRFAVQPYQVVTAGASACWVNVVCPDDAIIVAVNAYDANGNLIATVTADECVISNPPSSSNWVFNPLKADFVMPAGAASACLVLDVEPAAMTTGIVWFDDLIFEVDSLIDGGLVDSTTLSKISGEQVAGPQGEADILTAWQNLIDQLASANTQTPVTGVQLAQMLQSVGQTALDASNAYQLGVSHQQILGNVSTQPFWSGIQPTGQVTFPLPSGTLPSASILAGQALTGFINTSPAITVGFVEFLAKASATPTGVYLNLYTVDSTTGDQTSIWSSSDLSAQISTSAFDWVAVDIPSASSPQLTLGQWCAWEIVSSSATITVVAQTFQQPNKAYQFPPNVGSSRSISTTGGASPASLTPSQLGYGGTAPFICMSVTDVPPLYRPPTMTPFTSGAGMYTYSIPSWAQVSGSEFDVVPIGGGGAGGDAAGSTGFLGFGAFTDFGQGGTAGSWAPKTLVYGTDIPLGTTELVVINGAGGCAPSGNGADTLIGTGFTTTPQFDALGDGASVYDTTISWTHTATAGSYLVVALETDFGTFDVKYGDTTMNPLGLAYLNNSGPNGALALFGLPNVSGGIQTITAKTLQKTYITGNSISVRAVSAVGKVTNIYSAGTAPSMTVPCGANQFIIQAFGATQAQMSAFTGGTKRYDNSYVSGSAHYQGLSLSTTTATTTFGTTLNVSDNWAGMAVALNPAGTVLVQAPGGLAGGPVAPTYYNPANSNQTATGLGAPNKSWGGRNYAGSADTTSSHLPGNPWGGGSASGDLSNSAENGGDGATWITARQSSVVSGGGAGSGGGIGGGSELSVAYEATGGGGENTTGAGLSWQHTSTGGPNAAVVLIGAVGYSAGVPTISCTYGTSQLTQTLSEFNYENISGLALGFFAFGLVGLPSGTQTVSLSSSGATTTYLAGNTLTYLNVGSFGNFYSTSGSGTALSLLNIPVATGELVVGGFADQQYALSAFNQNQRWIQTVTSSIPMVIGDATGTSSVDFIATAAAADAWGALAGVLIPQS